MCTWRDARVALAGPRTQLLGALSVTWCGHSLGVWWVCGWLRKVRCGRRWEEAVRKHVQTERKSMVAEGLDNAEGTCICCQGAKVAMIVDCLVASQKAQEHHVQLLRKGW